MRFPKSLSIGTRVPFVRTPALPALGPGSMSSLLGVALGAAFWILALLTIGAVLIFLFLVFVPLGPLDLVATSEDGGTSVPVPRAYVLFGIGAFAGYFAGFALILRHRRRLDRPDPGLAAGARRARAAQPVRPRDPRLFRARGLRPRRGVPRRRPSAPGVGVDDMTDRTAGTPGLFRFASGG